MKKALIIIALTLFSAQLFAQQAKQVNPPIKGIGVVIKKNPGSGASIILNPTPEGRANFSLSEEGNLTIKMTDLLVSSQRAPVKGLKVGLSKNPSFAIIARAVSDENGEVEFKNLAPGDYAIEITESGKSELLPIFDRWGNKQGTKTPAKGVQKTEVKTDLYKKQ